METEDGRKKKTSRGFLTFLRNFFLCHLRVRVVSLLVFAVLRLPSWGGGRSTIQKVETRVGKHFEMGRFDMAFPSLCISPPPHANMLAHALTHTNTHTHKRPSFTLWFVCRSERAGTLSSLTHTLNSTLCFTCLQLNRDSLPGRVCVFVCVYDDAVLMQSLIHLPYLFPCHSSVFSYVRLLSEQPACLSSARCSQVWLSDVSSAQTPESSVLCCVITGLTN